MSFELIQAVKQLCGSQYEIVTYAAFFRLSTLKSCTATLVMIVTMSCRSTVKVSPIARTALVLFPL
nr:MAG TPA_asm: hypothetical protein [Caudoviricetes sp.]